MRRWSAALGFGLLGCLLVVSAGCGGADAATTEMTVAIRFSRFSATTDSVRAGVPVTITLRNDDPIDHEWIVGTAAVHATHRTGTEPVHATQPTEVTVPALSTRVTTITFKDAGEYTYICHLPGHEAYGMVGTLRVIDD